MTINELEKIWSLLQQIAQNNNVSPEEVRKEIAACIDEAWSDPTAQPIQNHLFPNGKPSPESFIIQLAKQIK